MKKRTNFKGGLPMVSLVFILIVGLFSCNGNNTSQTEAEGSDSMHMSDNTGNSSTNHTGGDDGMVHDTINNPGGNNNGTDANNNTTGTNNNLSTDAAFMMKAAEINLEEIKLGKLAQEKGTVSHVKALGKMMVTDHTAAMAKLAALAQTKSVTIPATETEKIIGAYKTLAAKSGKDFDKSFSDIMVNGHKEAIALFEQTNRDTKDSEVKAMTTAMIPKLKTHLDHSEKCQKECEKNNP